MSESIPVDYPFYRYDDGASIKAARTSRYLARRSNRLIAFDVSARESWARIRYSRIFMRAVPRFHLAL